ncbi:MAG TPA: glycosyltransferase [Stellaceae bacterium]|nr:glycosyltransferase [Stellaceae bacterium]
MTKRIKVSCLYDGEFAGYPNLFHPLGMSGLSHPDIDFGFADDPEADAWFFHTVAIEPRRPRLVFHLEEVRALACLDGPWLDSFPAPAVEGRLRALLESDRYKAIVTHLDLTDTGLRSYFRSDIIDAKIRRAALGIARKPDRTAVDRPFTLVFTNSFHHHPDNLVRRGFAELLLAFRALRQEVRDAQLLVYARGLSAEPEDGVTVISDSLDEEGIDRLYARADAAVLWAVDLHSHTTLRSIAMGCVTIVSDAPGYAELVRTGATGFIVPGRYGRDCYVHPRGRTFSRRHITEVNAEAAGRIAALLIELARDRDYTLAFARRAQETIRAERTLDDWQSDFGEIFLEAAAA